MSKKMMLLALSVASAALFALPAIASATPAHISATEGFTVTDSNIVILETAATETVECRGGMIGEGSFESTTTGTINLAFHGCTIPGFTCSTTGQAPGAIVTTSLPFHLISIARHSPGVLFTPGKDLSGNSHFVSYTCAGGIISKNVTGNGFIGTLASPTCGTASTTATLSLEEGVVGFQNPTAFTGVNFHWASKGVSMAVLATGQIHFPVAKTITCT